MTHYIQQGSTIRITADSNLIIKNKLEVGTYTINVNPMSGEISLERVDNYSYIGKLYGDIDQRAWRILNTFIDRPNSTGVLLSGEKGTGKTLLAKLISMKGYSKDIPTIVINQQLAGEEFNRFIQSIDQECIIIFDEFEKIYTDQKAQQRLLTLLDGVYPTKKLFILTTNDLTKIDNMMINRPGRLYYNINYSTLDKEFVREYAEDSLKDKSKVAEIVELPNVLTNLNFDMLKAVIEEMNRYNESASNALKILNVRPEMTKFMYDVKVMVGNKEIHSTAKNIYVNPSHEFKIVVDNPTVSKDKIVREEVYVHPHEELESYRDGTYTYKVTEQIFNYKKEEHEQIEFTINLSREESEDPATLSERLMMQTFNAIRTSDPDEDYYDDDDGAYQDDLDDYEYE